MSYSFPNSLSLILEQIFKHFISTSPLLMTDKKENNVRVSGAKRKFVYVDYTKHRLAEGVPEIFISGLGSAIADAVSVAELLKNQGLVEVKQIRTSRGDAEAARNNYVDKIEITVVKSKDFDAKYAEQQKQREAAAEARKAAE